MIDGDYGFIGNKIDNSSYSAINSGVKNRIFRAGDSSLSTTDETAMVVKTIKFPEIILSHSEYMLL